MARFRYKARDTQGKEVRGELEAENRNAVAAQLFSSGITPLSISAAARGAEALQFRLPLFLQARPSVVDMMLFSRQMYALTKAGIPIVRALRGLSETTHNETLGNALREVIDSLEAGHSLAGGLAQHPKIFSPLYVNVIRVGENSGKLDEAFLRMYHHLGFEKDITDRIKATLRYPTMVVVAVGLAMAVIMWVVVPQFARIFSAFGGQLPLPTRVMIGVSHFMTTYWYLVVAGFAAAVWGVRSYLGTTAGRLNWDRLKFRLPLIGSIILRASLARFARSFSMAFRSGVPLLQALHLVSYAVGNEYLGERIRTMRDSVERGESFSRAATAAGLFPPLVLQMLSVGDETGNINEMMDEVADFYDQEVKHDVQNLGTVIEPLLIISVGGIVMLLALGVFLPMWDLAGVALKH